MPTAAKIDRHDLVIGQPENWDEAKHGHCGGLAVRFEEIGELRFMRSAWEFTPAEAHMLLCGAKLVLGVCAPVHPVVCMDVGPMPADFRPMLVVRPFVATDGRNSVRVEALYAGGDRLRRVFVERHVDEGGLSIATGRAIEAIEELVRENGWTQ